MSDNQLPNEPLGAGQPGSSSSIGTSDAFDQAAPIARESLNEEIAGSGPSPSSDDGFLARRRHRKAAQVPYWDRPKPVRNLNWFLGKLGSTLIILGVLIFLFVGYQLWGTGIEAAQSQNRLEDKFSQTTQTTAPTSPSEPAPIPDPVVINNGDPMAILEMPTLGVTKYVVAGVETADLKKGPGHYPNTPFPGELGNAAIAGHRTTYGEPFRQLDELQTGDPIIVTDLLGRRFVYLVTEQIIVQPEDSWVVNTVDPTVAKLTLTTCHPEFSAKQRLIVFATLDASQSDPAVDPAAVYSANVGTSSGLDELNTSPTDTQTPGVDQEPDANIVGGSTTEVPTGDIATENGSPESSNISDQQDSEDVFNKGWFSDPDAYPQVALWLFIEFLIIMGAWQIAKRFRNRAIGVAVGFIPAVVTLYFIFQNVNRLLPPNL